LMGFCSSSFNVFSLEKEEEEEESCAIVSLVIKSRTTTYPSFPHVATCTLFSPSDAGVDVLLFLKFEGERTLAIVMPAAWPNSNAGALVASTTRTSEDEGDMLPEIFLCLFLRVSVSQRRARASLL